MKPEEIRHRLLRIPKALHRRYDRAMSPQLGSNHPRRKEFRQRWSGRVALTPGEFLDRLPAPDIREQSTEKWFAAQKALALHPRPDWFGFNAILDEGAVPLSGAASRLTELAANPLGRQARMRRLDPGGPPIAAPLPLIRPFDQPSPNGVQNHIPAHLEEVALLLDQNRLIAPLEEMPHPAVPPVEGLRIDAIELPHAQDEIPLGGLDDQVVMVSHEAIAVAAPAVAVGHPPQRDEKLLPVTVVFEYRLSRVPAGGNVVDCPGILNAQRPCHRRFLLQDGSNVKIQDLTPFPSRSALDPPS